MSARSLQRAYGLLRSDSRAETVAAFVIVLAVSWPLVSEVLKSRLSGRSAGQ